MATYTISDSVYAAVPYSVVFLATEAAAFQPVQIDDSVYVVPSDYSVSFFSTELAELKPVEILDTVWSALPSYPLDFLSTFGATLLPSTTQSLYSAYSVPYSPQYISTVSASLKAKDISGTVVLDIFTKPTPSFGQIWPPGLPE